MNTNDNLRSDHNEEDTSSGEGNLLKGVFSRVKETCSSIFLKNPSATIKILTDEQAPPKQISAVLSNIAKVIQRNPSRDAEFKAIIIDLVLGEYNSAAEVRAAAADTLQKINALDDPEIGRKKIIDLLATALETIHQDLSDAIVNLFLSTTTIDAKKILANTLVNRFQIDGELGADAWQVFARALSFNFTAQIAQINDKLRSQMQHIQDPDKKIQQIKQETYYLKQYVDILNKSREDICSYLEKNRYGEKIAQSLRLPSLTSSYHENAKLVNKLTHILNCVLCDRKDLRDLAISSLKEIRSPVVYNECRSLILDDSPHYPDICESLTGALMFAAQTDENAQDTVISMLSTPPQLCAEFFFSELERTAKINEIFHSKLLAATKGFIKRRDCGEYIIQELIKRILPINISQNTLEFIVLTVTGKIKVSISEACESVAIITSLNNPKNQFCPTASKYLKLIMTNKVPTDIKLRIISEAKNLANPENLTLIELGVYESDAAISDAALKAYFELARNKKIMANDFIDFICRALTNNNISENAKNLILKFLKNYPERSEELIKITSSFIYGEHDNFRLDAFDLQLSWMNSPKNDEEFLDIITRFSNIIANVSWKFQDIYKKTAFAVSGFLTSQSERVPIFQEMLLTKIKTALVSPISDEYKIILCDALEEIASVHESSSSQQASLIFDSLIKNERLRNSVSVNIRLKAAKFLIVKQARITKYLPFIIQSLNDEEYDNKAEILGIALGGLKALKHYEISDKINAVKTGSPLNICDYVRLELNMGAELCPILISLLKQNFNDIDIVLKSIELLKSIEYARKYSDFILEFRDYPNYPEIQAAAIDTVSEFLYPPYYETEGHIMIKIMRLVTDHSLRMSVRLAALKGITKIADAAFLEMLTDLVLDKKEKDEIRIEGINAIASLYLISSNAVYAEILSDPENSWKLKEAVLHVILESADSTITGILLGLISEAPTPYLKELITKTLSDSGYSEALEIWRLDEEYENLILKLKLMEAEAEKALQEKTSAQAASSSLQNSLKQLKEAHDKSQKDINAIREDLSALENKWINTKGSITLQIQRIAPKWPKIPKCPPEGNAARFNDLIELYRDEQEKFTEDKESYTKILHEKAERTRLLERKMREADEKIKNFDVEIEKLNKIIMLPNSEGREIKRKAAENRADRETSVSILNQNRRSIDTKIQEKLNGNLKDKEKRDKIRALYVNFLNSNIDK